MLAWQESISPKCHWVRAAKRRQETAGAVISSTKECTEQNDTALLIGAYRALACTYYYLSDFEAARQYAIDGVQIWCSKDVHGSTKE
jgi:hypothetical protein